MTILLRTKKGMTMLEVMIAITLLSLVSVPLIMSFMNSLMISKLSKNQIEVNTITRSVKEFVTDGFSNNWFINDVDIDNDGDSIEHRIDLNGDGSADDYLDLLSVGGVLATSVDNLIITTPDMNIPNIDDYVFTIHYDSANFHDPAYENTRNVLVTIYNKDHKVVNKLKITVTIEK